MKKAKKRGLQDESGKDEIVLDLKKITSFKNIEYEYIFLLAFLILGFYIRSYHIDYPAIGYHNMKENEYLGSAKFMYYDGDYLHRKLYRMGNQDIPYFEEYPQIPLIQWSTVILWKIFGMQLWLPRLLMILASVGSIYVTYMLVSELTKSKYLSLLSSFFMTILPLGVFFGRNIQPESPALFFMLLGALYSVRWMERLDTKNALYAGLFLGIAALFKYTFLIMLLPLVFLFPFSKLKEKGFLKSLKSPAIYALIGLLPMIIWTLIAPFLNKVTAFTAGTASRIDLFRIFSISYWHDFWPSFSNYLGDSFTWWYFWAAVFGVMLVGFTMKDKRITMLSIAGVVLAIFARMSTPGETAFIICFFLIFAIVVANAVLSIRQKKAFQTFILFYAAAVIPYSMILADYIKGHNYYQMPFLPLIAILSAYLIYTIGIFLRQITKSDIIQYAPLILILLTIPSVQAHKNAMFDTQFFGLDAAGTYLKQAMADGQRFFMFGDSQSVAACTYSEHLCVGAGTLEEFQELEQKRGVEWLFIDVRLGGIGRLQSDQALYDYVQQNYALVAAGILKTPQGFQPTAFILRRGGNVSFENLSAEPVFQKQPVIQTRYELADNTINHWYDALNPSKLRGRNSYLDYFVIG